MPKLCKGDKHVVKNSGVYTVEEAGKVTFVGDSCSVWSDDKVVKLLTREDNTCDVVKGYTCFPQDGTLSLN